MLLLGYAKVRLFDVGRSEVFAAEARRRGAFCSAVEPGVSAPGVEAIVMAAVHLIVVGGYRLLSVAVTAPLAQTEKQH